MTGPRAIFLALDLARMPALAMSAAAPVVPDDALELIRIAAACPTACRAAEAATGVPVDRLMEAARFYLQQALFRADADCYRVLGLQPGASRDVARRHLRWLLQWLHPDRNSGWDNVYAERVVKAWREVSLSVRLNDAGQPIHSRAAPPRRAQSNVIRPVRLPWIQRPPQPSSPRPRGGLSGSVLRVLTVLTSLGVILLLTVQPALGSDGCLDGRSSWQSVARPAAILPQGQAGR